MQIVSFGDNLHERSTAIFCEKEVKYFKISSAYIFIQHAKR